MTNMKPKLTTKLRHISRAAPKRVIALVLTFLFAFNAASVLEAFPAYAEGESQTAGESTVQTSEPTASVTNDDLQISGSNSFGNMLATKVNDYQNGGDEDEYTEGYSVIGIEMNGKTATVEYNAVENCMLVVGLYTEDGVKMLGSGNATVSSDSQSTNVEIAISEMPQYYLVKAFLVNPSNYYPLCKVFTCELYTKSIQEVIKSTVQDYPNREILNLDGDNATNFAVYGLGVTVVEQSENVNVYQSDDSDPDHGKYVFANADSEFASLKVGDVFSHERGAEVIIARVKSIEAIQNGNGTYTLTIFEDDNISMEDVFDYVKIETNGKLGDCYVDNSVLDEDTTPVDYQDSPAYELFEDSNTTSSTNTNSVSPKEYGWNYTMQPEAKITALHLEGDVQPSVDAGTVVYKSTYKVDVCAKFTVTAKIYTSFTEAYIEVKSEISVYASGTITCSVELPSKPLGDIYFNPIPGLKIGFKPKVTLKFSVSVELKGSFSKTFGFKFSTNGGYSDLGTPAKSDLKTSIKGTVFFGIDLVPHISVLCDQILDVSATATAGITITGKEEIPLYDSNDDSMHLCNSCIKGDVSFITTFNVGITVFSKYFPSPKLGIKEPVKLFDWYHSHDYNEFRLFSKCPHYVYKITVLAIGKEGDPLKDIPIYNKTDMNKELARTDDTGTAMFYLPNGTYTLVAAKEMLAEQEITVKDKPVTVNMNLNVLIDENGNLIYFGKCGANAEWRLNRDTGVLTISGEGAMNDYESENVVPWRYLKSYITSVEFEGAITSIGDRSFLNCSNLTNVNLSDSIESIGVNSFRLCTKLAKVIFPDSLQIIKENAFSNCSSLVYIYPGRSLKKIEKGGFYQTALQNVVLPDSLEAIGPFAFQGCWNLSKIVIPESVKSVGLCAFTDARNLKTVGPLGSESNIEIGWKKRVPDYAFSCNLMANSYIERVILPDSIEEIGSNAFFYCDNLKEIELPNSLKSIYEQAFRACKALKKIDLPESASFIDYATFVSCEELEEVVLPKSLTYIGYLAFGWCSNLKTILYTGSEEDWKKINIDKEACISKPTVYNYNRSEESGENPSSSPTPMHSPDASGTLSATFDNLIPNANYLFVVSKSSDLDNMLDASNLLFIDEKTAGDSGSLTFGYIPREDYEGAVVKIFGPVNPSVTLDKTSATLKKGDKLTLTAMVDQEHSASDVGWASSNTGIATVSDSGEVTAVGFGDVEIIATLGDCAVKCLVSVVPELDFTILGASIRLIEPYGIRFGIQLGKGGDYANVKIVDYGTIMKPTELLDGEDLTLETGNVQKIPAKVIYSENDAMKIYTGVLINIPTTYFDTAISGRGYFIYEDENGVNHTVYTDIVSMSFNDVVNAAYQKYTSLPNPTDAQKEIIARLEVLRAMSVND